MFDLIPDMFDLIVVNALATAGCGILLLPFVYLYSRSTGSNRPIIYLAKLLLMVYAVKVLGLLGLFIICLWLDPFPQKEHATLTGAAPAPAPPRPYPLPPVPDIHTKCPNCATPLTIPAKYAGTQGQCNHCHATLQVPLA